MAKEKLAPELLDALQGKLLVEDKNITGHLFKNLEIKFSIRSEIWNALSGSLEDGSKYIRADVLANLEKTLLKSLKFNYVTVIALLNILSKLAEVEEVNEDFQDSQPLVLQELQYKLEGVWWGEADFTSDLFEYPKDKKVLLSKLKELADSLTIKEKKAFFLIVSVAADDGKVRPDFRFNLGFLAKKSKTWLRNNGLPANSLKALQLIFQKLT